MDKIYREGFCLLLPSTQRRIAGALYRLCNDLAAPLGCDSLTYAEFCGLISEHDKQIPWSIVRKLVLGNAARDSDSLDFSPLDTEEKLEALMLSAPDPTPEDLEVCLRVMGGALPLLRTFLIDRK